jgi:hypothetical protein
MKNSQKYLGVVVLVMLVIGAGVAYLLMNNKPKKIAPDPINDLPALETKVSPTVATERLTPAPTVKANRFSPEVRAAVRKEFISNCQVKAKTTVAVCTCAADYLAKNYSDAQLEQIYVQYHSTSQVPSAIQSAVEQACKE